jgi:hypothetical protein
MRRQILEKSKLTLKKSKGSYDSHAKVAISGNTTSGWE